MSMPYVFLLGAGASNKAGVPLVDEMTKIFEDDIEKITRSYLKEHKEIEKTKLQELAPKALKSLRDCITSAGKKFDVEILLEALTKLTNENEVLHILRPKSDDTFREIYPHLKIMLMNFIRKTCESIKDIDYLYPLKGFIGEKGLDLFTLNYDGTIEVMCEKFEVPCHDGFSPNWNPQGMETDERGIRLYKIHGSLFWFKTGKSRYVKIPVKGIDLKDLRYFTDENVSETIIYPLLSKEVYTGPFPWLIQEFRTKLLKAKLCIIIGYSFRDESIRKIIFEQMESNPDLWLYLIDPHGQDRKDMILSLRSDFFDRILTIDLKAENALTGRLLVENVRLLEMARNQEEDARKLLLETSVLHSEVWEGCIHNYKRIRHFDRIRSMIEEIMQYEYKGWAGSLPIQWMLLDLAIQFSIQYVMQNEKGKAKFWLKMFRDCWASVEYSIDRRPTGLVPDDQLPDWHATYRGEFRLHGEGFQGLKNEIENAIKMLPRDHGIVMILRQISESITKLLASQEAERGLLGYRSFVQEHEDRSLFKLSTDLLNQLDD